MKEIAGGIVNGIKELFNFPLYSGKDVSITASTILLIIISCIIAFYILKLIRRLITSKLPLEDKGKFVSIFKFVNYIVYIIVVIIVLSSSGVNLTVLLTASAALFVGLGFALQYLFQDIISGVLIIVDQSLHVGDVVEIDGKVARVIDIKLRTTRAITRDDKIVIIPNHFFLTDIIYNYTQNHKTTRETITVGVAYGSDTALVKKILLKSLESQDGVLKKPKPNVIFNDFGDSALVFNLNFYISDSFTDPSIKSDVRFKIDQLFREHNVTIPFPQRDVHIFNK
ncbi:mechanosensitive ion channel [Galbibacter sp. EGI 63066]|uniref:mechanosensitive ion channel family protein n=1 Tax=Galbibacter sp. EGI 63066 TaxID=2993559 RepID=UPI0022488CB4|nr:mechanosensitive ion channel domain-containing protein [Galbibacter sp. EGI 63066]MCX2678567.1 mechanosensitive ion channel [Galbibacter sp. EGI 63066]